MDASVGRLKRTECCTAVSSQSVLSEPICASASWYARAKPAGVLRVGNRHQRHENRVGVGQSALSPGITFLLESNAASELHDVRIRCVRPIDVDSYNVLTWRFLNPT